MELFLSNLVKRPRTRPLKQDAEIGSMVYVLCTSSSPVEFWLHATGKMPPNANVTVATINNIHTLTIYIFGDFNYGKYICRGKDTNDGKYVYFISESTVNRPGIIFIEVNTIPCFRYNIFIML